MHKNNSSVMKRWLAPFILVLSGLFPSPNYSQTENVVALTDYRFACYRNPKDGTPTTFAIRGDDQGRVGVPIISWRSRAFSSSGWTPAQRCKVVSERFNNSYNKNNLEYISNAYFAGQPAICWFKDMARRTSCTSENLLFTLTDSSDADRVLEQLSAILTGGASAPLSIIDDGGLVLPNGETRACLSRSASGNCSGVLFTTLVQ